MDVDFVNQLSRKLGIERRDLIEKDIILHQMTADIFFPIRARNAHPFLCKMGNWSIFHNCWNACGKFG